MAEPGQTVLRSPLHDRQVALGAKFAEFGGWSMPLEFAGAGVVAEHTAVRTTVGIFDVSHLGKISVHGPAAAEFLNRCLSADLGKITDGQAQYTLICADDGGVIDDLIAYRLSADDVFLIPNAANCARVAESLAAAAPSAVEVVNQHQDYAVLAVQGQLSDEVLAGAGLPVGHDYMSFVSARLAGAPITVCRTGYTGERGYELVCPTEAAGDIWDLLMAAGGPSGGLQAAGLGARDTLRTEMGYPLCGQDITADITPVQARLGWAVGWAKPDFFGAQALRAEKAAGPHRTLRGLQAVSRGIARPGMTVRDRQGNAIGIITSGTFSPTLRRGVALALLDPSVSVSDEVVVDIRSRAEPFTVAKPPFVTPGVRGS